MKKFSFDISWKGIILVLIILAFLLGVVDRVSAEEVPISKYHTTVTDRMYEFQKIEDRLIRIAKEEDEISDDSWFRVYDAKDMASDYTLFKYRYYNGSTRKLVNQTCILKDALVDKIYQQNLILKTDAIWLNAVDRITNYYNQ